MNRIIVCGVAVFFAIAAIAMLGTTNTAVAGHGCSGCDGGSECHGEVSCGGHAHRCGLFKHLRRRCHGRHHGCHAAPACCGEAHVEVEAAPAEEAAPEEAAPAAPAAAEPAPAGEARFVAPARVRFVRFRR